MKPSFEAVHTGQNSSFLVRQFKEKSFAAPYHFHPELELTLIVSGSGKRYVGSHMNDFTAGDFVLLGSNLPHCWKTEITDPLLLSSSIVIHFQKYFLGDTFFSRPEMQALQRLVDKSDQGIQFTGDTTSMQEQMIRIQQEPDSFKRILIFLDLFQSLAHHTETILLDKKNTYTTLSAVEQKKMHAVMAYIVENFKENISLGKAAAAAHMTTPAFCKYFKRITRKTFIESVTDYRIDFAVKELVNSDKSIAQVGFDSGFNDISNFHKIFKQRLKTSPLNYRRQFTEEGTTTRTKQKQG